MTPEQFASIGVDAPTILYVMSWGFSFVVGSFFLGWCIGIAVDMIKKI